MTFLVPVTGAASAEVIHGRLPIKSNVNEMISAARRRGGLKAAIIFLEIFRSRSGTILVVLIFFSPLFYGWFDPTSDSAEDLLSGNASKRSRRAIRVPDKMVVEKSIKMLRYQIVNFRDAKRIC
jgi:hypothetical protein